MQHRITEKRCTHTYLFTHTYTKVGGLVVASLITVPQSGKIRLFTSLDLQLGCHSNSNVTGATAHRRGCCWIEQSWGICSQFVTLFYYCSILVCNLLHKKNRIKFSSTKVICKVLLTKTKRRANIMVLNKHAGR